MLPPYSLMGDRIQAMDDCTDDIDGDDDKDGQRCNDETDNLSDWQYLTATYDDDQMFAGDAELTDVSERVSDRLQNSHAVLPENTQAAVTLKRSRSNFSMFDGFQEANIRNHGLTIPTDNHYDTARTFSSKKSPTAVSSRHSEIEQPHSIELRVKSWSHPQLHSQAPQYLSGWQPDFVPTLNFMHQSREFSDFPSPSLSLSERSEKYPLLTGQLDINKRNHFPLYHEPLVAAQLPNTALSKSHKKQENPGDSTLLHSGVRNFKVEIPGPYDQLERVVSTTKHIGYPKDDTDNRFKSIQTAVSQQYMPSATQIMSTATDGDASATASHKDAVMNHNSKLSHPKFLIGSAHDASTQDNIAIPNMSQEPFNNTMIEQQMRIWMTMIGTATSIPPYQQFRNKKLLLHPLTPYNYYYRDERDNIVAQISDESDPLPPSVSDFTGTKMQALLHQHWFVDPVKKKRKHRKSHGKMNFQRLSKVIAQRWHELPVHGRDFYRLVARYDDLYYHQQLDSIKERSEKETNTHI